VVVAYDDSDGWYDHVYSGVRNPSKTSGVATPPGPQDFPTGPGLCGPGSAVPLAGLNGRCGYGPRMPLLVISPFARKGLRRSHPDRSELNPALRRGQLEAPEDQRFVRCHRRLDNQHVRLQPQPVPQFESVPRPDHRSADRGLHPAG
jgi:hypothetical protein